MDKNWGKYRLIILGLIILGFFISRTFFQKDDTPNSVPLNIGLNRNIDQLVLSHHAECRMKCRDITMEEVKEILREGQINYMKSNLKDERGPSYAVEGYSNDQQHLRIVFAPKENEIVVVSCIDLNKEWPCDCN